MASLDKAVAEDDEIVEEEDAPPPSADLARTLTLMAIDLMEQGGAMETLGKAINTSSNPAQAVGQFLVQLIAQLADAASKEFNFDPRVFLAKNGFLDNILDYIEGELDLPEEFSDQVYQEVVEMIRALAMGEKQQGGQQPQAGQPGIDQMAQQGAPAPQAGPGLDAAAMQGGIR